MEAAAAEGSALGRVGRRRAVERAWSSVLELSAEPQNFRYFSTMVV